MPDGKSRRELSIFIEVNVNKLILMQLNVIIIKCEALTDIISVVINYKTSQVIIPTHHRMMKTSIN